jgi:predicted PolB exonuclease-like 3'-5' exonuclease
VPQIVSWNGRGFDIPVLASRGLIHGVTAACFWDTGGDNKDFRYSNYLSRFHDRHVDLMDVLSIYGAGRGSPLDELARLSGFPGKLGVGGAAVWDSYGRGEIAAIRDYCEADCANTYLLYLRFQMMRCVYSVERYGSECALLRSLLEKRPEPHWHEFLSLWKS